MGAGFGQRLGEELARLLPSVAPQAVADRFGDELSGMAEAVDCAVRRVGAAALKAVGSPAAAAEVEALPPVRDYAAARQTMMALEKIGRRQNAPNQLMRAVGGAASTLLLVERAGQNPEPRQRAAAQVAMAVGRVVGMALGAGAQADGIARIWT